MTNADAARVLKHMLDGFLSSGVEDAELTEAIGLAVTALNERYEVVEDHPDGDYRCQSCGHVDDAEEFRPPEGRADMCCPKCNSTNVWRLDCDHTKYNVEIDGVMTTMKEPSLAALCNKIRGCGKRIKVWSSDGLQLIDTKFGDSYNLAVADEDCFVCTCHAGQGQPCKCKRPLTRDQQIEKLLSERAK